MPVLLKWNEHMVVYYIMASGTSINVVVTKQRTHEIRFPRDFLAYLDSCSWMHYNFSPFLRLANTKYKLKNVKINAVHM